MKRLFGFLVLCALLVSLVAFVGCGEDKIIGSETESVSGVKVGRSDTYEVQQITFDSAKEDHPWFSPDGTRIMFGSDEYYFISIDGSARQIVSYQNLLSGWYAWGPQFTVDGRVIDTDEAHQIYIEDRDTGWKDYFYEFEWKGKIDFKEIEKAIEDKGWKARSLGATSPAISRDGTLIAFLPRVETAPYGAIGYEILTIGGIVVSGADIQYFKVSDKGITELGNLCFSPDNTQIVFDAKINDNPDLFRLFLSGGEIERLTFSGGCYPNFSPDGTKIVFQSTRQGNPDLYIMDLTKPTGK